MFLAVLAASAKQAGNLTDARATPPRDGRMVVQTSRRDRSFDGAFDPKEPVALFSSTDRFTLEAAIR